MGYEHYLRRPAEMDLERWREWVGDVRTIIANLPTHVPQTYSNHEISITLQAPLIVTGPIGDEGRPELTDSRVAFNGGGWLDVGGQQRRQWCESFWVDRAFDTSPPTVEPDDDPFDL
jgi:hypothetical protein